MKKIAQFLKTALICVATLFALVIAYGVAQDYSGTVPYTNRPVSSLPK